jgi:NitT/TauT family transport system permease protein
MQDFLSDIRISVLRILTGFLVSVAVALPIGILMGCFKSVDALLSPFTSFVRYLPVPALLPFCILWFGIGEVEKVIVVFLGVFFQLILMVADIVRRVPNELLEISYTLGAGTRQAIWRVILPHSSPDIVDSLRITMGWAWGWLILAELVGASQGIGFMILKSQRYLLNANMIFGLLVLGALGVLTDLLLVALSKIIFKWVE